MEHLPKDQEKPIFDQVKGVYQSLLSRNFAPPASPSGESSKMYSNLTGIVSQAGSAPFSSSNKENNAHIFSINQMFTTPKQRGVGASTGGTSRFKTTPEKIMAQFGKHIDSVSEQQSEVLAAIQKLQENFSQEIGTLSKRVDQILETQEKILQKISNNFSGLKPMTSEPVQEQAVCQSPTGTFRQPFPVALSIKESESQKPGFPNLSFANAAYVVGFTDLKQAKTEASPSGSNKPETFKGFGGKAMSLFGKIKSAASTSCANAAGGDNAFNLDEEDKVEEFEPTKKFKPVVLLPPLIDVTLGDENENVMFEHRAKLYHFDSELKEFKEKGVGNIKILQDKDHSSKVRVLMWREKVLKLACNHWITGDIKVDFYQNNPKVLRWTAVDHAEQEARLGIFACRFANEEKAAEFKSKMEEMIETVGLGTGNAAQMENMETQDVKPLNEMFKKQVGSWDCTMCFVTNKSDKDKCMACQTANPRFESQDEKETINNHEEEPSEEDQKVVLRYNGRVPDEWVAFDLEYDEDASLSAAN